VPLIAQDEPVALASPAMVPPAGDVMVDFQPLSRPVIFSLIWMALLFAYIFHGPRTGAFPVGIAYAIVFTTIYALVVLSIRFRTFRFILLSFLDGVFHSRRRRRW
jgi:hypothetical protein